MEMPVNHGMFDCFAVLQNFGVFLNLLLSKKVTAKL